jgi:hypothetical protein
MEIKGKVIESFSGDPVPGATVEAWFSNVLLSRVAADNNGFFYLKSSSSPDRIIITSATTKSETFEDTFNRPVFEVERNVIEEPEIIIKSIIKKDNYTLLILGAVALLLLLGEKKKR